MNINTKTSSKKVRLIIAVILMIFAVYFVGRAIGEAYYHYSH